MTSENYVHSWNFGIKPSEYIAHSAKLTPRQEKAIEEVGEATLDHVFEYTLECPELRRFDWTKRWMLKFLNIFDSDPHMLVASYAKPGGEYTPIGIDADKAIGILSDLEINVKKDPRSGILFLNFDSVGNDTHLEANRRRQRGSLSQEGYDLMIGLLYGFPVADVIEYINHEGSSPSIKPLQHAIFPSKWNEFWNERVGIEGEKKLAKAYKSVL